MSVAIRLTVENKNRKTSIMALTPKQTTEIIKTAVSDKESGKFTEYKGSTLVDIVYAPIHAITGEPSSSDIAAEKQKIYNEVRTR